MSELEQNIKSEINFNNRNKIDFCLEEIILISVFGRKRFKEIKSFFTNLISNPEWDVIVFTTRRCHLLFCLFYNYIFSDLERDLAQSKLFITDKAIPLYEKEIKNKNIVIADDILIHGRTLDEICQRLKKKSPKSVVRKVYAISSDAQKNEKAEKYSETLDGVNWKELSNKIVIALLLTSTSYTSYLYSLQKKMEEDEFLSLKESFEKIFNIESNNVVKSNYVLDLSLDEERNDNDSSICLNDNLYGYVFPVLGSSGHSFIRLYYNKFIKRCTITPTYFLDPMDTEMIEKNCSKIFSDESNICNVDELATKYRAISSFYSYNILFNEKINNIITIDEWQNNSKDIDLSFYKGFFEKEIMSIKEELTPIYSASIIDFSGYRVKTYFNGNYSFIKNDIYKKMFLEELTGFDKEEFDFEGTNNHQNHTILFYNYLRKVNREEERVYTENSKKQEDTEKQRGLPFFMLKKLEEENNIGILEPVEYYSKIINGSDCAFITFYPDYFYINDKVYCANFLITGEQVCRLYQNPYLIFLYELYRFFEKISKKTVTKKSFSSYLNTLLEKEKNLVSPNTIINIRKTFKYLSKNWNYNVPFFLDSIYEIESNDDLHLLIENSCNYLF